MAGLMSLSTTSLNGNVERKRANTVDTYRSSSTASDSFDLCAGSFSSLARRVQRTVENAGERIAYTKKKVTWQFELPGGERNVHTVMLEHSIFSGKKRLRVDGVRVLDEESWGVGAWHYDLTLYGPTGRSAHVRVGIDDVASSVGTWSDFYVLIVDGISWQALPEREVIAEHKEAPVWSSGMYARRVDFAQRSLKEAVSDRSHQKDAIGTATSWTFAFGQKADKIHILELFHWTKDGKIEILLDSSVQHTARFDSALDESYKHDCVVAEPAAGETDKHVATIHVSTVNDHTEYEILLDGCMWSELGQTTFELKDGWAPILSRSKGAIYYCNRATKEAQWDRPIQPRTRDLDARSGRCSTILEVPTPVASPKDASQPETERSEHEAWEGEEEEDEDDPFRMQFCRRNTE